MNAATTVSFGVSHAGRKRRRASSNRPRSSLSTRSRRGWIEGAERLSYLSAWSCQASGYAGRRSRRCRAIAALRPRNVKNPYVLEGESTLNTPANLIGRMLRQMSWAFVANPWLLETLLEEIEEELGVNPSPELAEIYRLMCEWHAQQDETDLEE